jgi:tetratricopeptide (TPR) repeat protein
VRDPAAYAQLLAMLLGTAEGAAASAPWPPQVRLIARELGTGAASASALRCDFSPAAVTCSLRETTIDPRQPEAVRMHALLVLAQQEQAQGRAAAAIALYTQVLAYHREKRNLAMQAVVLLQLGETHHRQMQLAQARQCYEQALTPAAAQAPPCVAQLAKNLGDLAMLEQHPDEAVRCYRTWARIAEHLGDQHGAAAARTQLRQAASLRRNLPEQSQEAQ